MVCSKILLRDVAGAITYLAPASGRTMATESQIQKVFTRLSKVHSCTSCGIRLRFGDLECPHCGTDLEEYLRHWAEKLIIKLELGTGL